MYGLHCYFVEASVENRVIVKPDLMTAIHDFETTKKNISDKNISREDYRHLDGSDFERVDELFSIDHDIVRPNETKTATRGFLLDPNEINNHTHEEKTEQFINTKQVLQEFEVYYGEFLNKPEENENADPQNNVAKIVKTYIKSKFDLAEIAQLTTNNDFGRFTKLSRIEVRDFLNVCRSYFGRFAVDSF